MIYLLGQQNKTKKMNKWDYIKLQNFPQQRKPPKKCRDLQDGSLGKHGLTPRTTTSKLQLNYRTTIAQASRNRGPATTELKRKPHLSRLMGGKEIRRRETGWSYINVWWIKNGRDISGARVSSPTPGSPAQGLSARKINSHNFCLQN